MRRRNYRREVYFTLLSFGHGGLALWAADRGETATALVLGLASVVFMGMGNNEAAYP